MPELPEVETMRRGILSVVGTKIQRVSYPRSSYKPIVITPSRRALRERLKGRTIEAVERIGKRVALKTDDDQTLIFEPRMTGLVLLADPPNLIHLRCEFHLSGGDPSRLLFWDRRGLGSVKLFRRKELEQEYGPNKLGPDALQVTGEMLDQRLRESRREVKVALLDQKVVAGIGNLYASEILHRAQIHPAASCQRLNRIQWKRIADSTLFILREAIKYEGSTLSDGTYRNALNQAGDYQSQHCVYDREGKVCPECDRSEIVRIVQCQRSTFYCPHCQKKTVKR